MKKVLFICVTMLLICISGKATERNLLLIPYPQQVSIKQGNYNLTDNVKIGADPLFTQELKKLQEVLTEDFGLKSQIVKPSKADISLCYDASFMQEEKEAYQLEVTDMKITIRPNGNGHILRHSVVAPTYQIGSRKMDNPKIDHN